MTYIVGRDFAQAGKRVDIAVPVDPPRCIFGSLPTQRHRDVAHDEGRAEHVPAQRLAVERLQELVVGVVEVRVLALHALAEDVAGAEKGEIANDERRCEATELRNVDALQAAGGSGLQRVRVAAVVLHLGRFAASGAMAAFYTHQC